MNSTGLFFTIILVLWGLALNAASAGEQRYTIPVSAVAEQQVPPGAARFCEEHAQHCVGGGRYYVPETGPLAALVYTINRDVNHTYQPANDVEIYGVRDRWAFPVRDGRADCEDYALEKRRRLVSMGWPPSAALIAIARLKSDPGSYHAVLLVRTDRGDFVLDNIVAHIRLWSETDYEFVMRQDENDVSQWVWLTS